MAEDASNTDAPELAQAREDILLATLRHVPFDGWTEKALDAGKAEAGHRDALNALAFPGGLENLAEYYSSFADQRMAEGVDAAALAEMRIRDKIATVVRLRLSQAAGEREALKVLMAWLAFPANQPLAAKCLYRTVDCIWRAIGDSSTDFNFYSKRAILAGVLAATVLYWLGDETEGAADTEAFLVRRIEDVMAIEKVKGRAREMIAELPDPFRILRDITQRGPRAGDDTGAPGSSPGGDADTPGDDAAAKP